MRDRQYPIGRFNYEGPVTDRGWRRWTDEVAALPRQVHQTLEGMSEDAPTIRPYDEVRWAELPDVHAVPVETALDFLHTR